MKTVLITGAGRGIGLELVKEFINNNSYQVIATSRDVANLQKLRSQQLQIIKGDLIEDFDSIISQINSPETSIDILINNAAMVLNKSITSTTNEDLRNVMEANFIAPYKLIRDLVQCFISGAHIVNISSISGFQGSRKFNGLSAYSASKAALASLSECVAEEWRDKNISCNCLALGAVQTEMIKVSIPGLKATISAEQMAGYIYDFAINGRQFYNGQVIPVTISTL